MSTIAKAYWRSICRGARRFETVPETLKGEVLALAEGDFKAGRLTEAQYREIVGEDEA